MFDFMNKVVNDDNMNNDTPNKYSKFINTNLQYIVMKRKHNEVLNEMNKRRNPLGIVNGKLIILLKDFKFTYITSDILV